MFETIMVTILVSAMCGLIREYGGFEALLGFIKRIFHGQRGGQLGIGLLRRRDGHRHGQQYRRHRHGHGPIAKQMSEEYGISGKKSASLLDTFSCIFQGIIPYGAQMLLAISACAELGETLTAFEIIPCLFYPYLLLISSLVFIFLIPEKNRKPSSRLPWSRDSRFYKAKAAMQRIAASGAEGEI
ncbi:MAG: sodium:proton antiporter [Acutalibacteraceae bacterium]